jgi:hypothetical protein
LAGVDESSGYHSAIHARCSRDWPPGAALPDDGLVAGTIRQSRHRVERIHWRPGGPAGERALDAGRRKGRFVRIFHDEQPLD